MSLAVMTLAEYKAVILWVVVLGVLWGLVRSLCTQCAALIYTVGDLKRLQSLYNKSPAALILFRKNLV